MTNPTPQMAKAPTAGTVEALRESQSRADSSPEPHRLTSLFTQFESVGHTVYQIVPTGFIVSRWGYTRHCPNLYCLATMARQMGLSQ